MHYGKALDIGPAPIMMAIGRPTEPDIGRPAGGMLLAYPGAMAEVLLADSLDVPADRNP